MAKISVIIPCYNQEKYIAECLDSVLAQTFNDYEAIVVNDGSTDSSLTIIQQYIDKYPHFKLINQINQGVISAHNNAIKEAKGEYIFPLDVDDKIAPTCLEKMYQTLETSKGNVIYSESEFFGKCSGINHHLEATKINMALANRVVCSALYRKSDWEKYGGYDPMIRNRLEDWEFWLNFVEENKVFYKIKETLFFYRISEASRNQSISKTTQKAPKKLVRQKHSQLYGLSFKKHFIILILLRFFYQKKITKSGKLFIKVYKIPVYWRKVS